MVVPLVEIVRTIITILHQIVVLAQTAKRYRRKCGLLKGRVYLIVHLLEELHKSPCMVDSATEIMLNELRDATDRALALVKSCQRKKVWDFFKSYKKAAEFDALQEQITYIMQHFHIANRILMLNLNKQQFFMTVLDKLLLGGACQRLPQSVKEDLKSYISGLENCQHMSPDAKRLLERIVSDLNCRAAASSRTTSDPSGGAAGATGGYLVDDVVRIANGILEAARTVKPKKKYLLQVRQLARYAEQAIDLLQQLPVPATQDTVRSLREALREGRNIVRDMQLTRSGSYSNEISSVLYRIEYYLQIILVSACSHVHQTMHKKGR